MPLRIEIQTNIDDNALTIEDVNALIASLKMTYANVRRDMYSHFLSIKHLIREFIFIGILFFLYEVTEDNFYVYFMPISLLIAFIGSIISAEILTKRTKQTMLERIEHYKLLKAKLNQAE